MHPELENISEHMKEIGLGLLSQAQANAFFWHPKNRLDEGIFAIIQTAHAAEILIKACIAEHHPLLIFTKLPKSVNVEENLLDFDSLFESGRSLDYKELPDRLWAITGYKIEEIEVYRSLGKLRNGIQHFAVPEINLSQACSEFIYKVIDPILEHFWGLYAVEYCDDEELEINLIPALVKRGIDFRYPERWEEYVEQAQ